MARVECPLSVSAVDTTFLALALATFLAPSALAAPSNLVATTVSATEIDLAWTDNAVENGFKVERSTDGTNFFQIAQLLPNTTAYRDTRVWPSTVYLYRVRAYNSDTNAVSPVSSASSAALCGTSVVGWGDNYYGQSTPPAGLTNVVAIACGDYQSLALGSDNTLVGWGGNWVGQATPPSGLKGVTAIAGGYLHSLALKSDGTVVGWGWNLYGQASPPAGLTGVVAIAAGYYHSLALKSDGTVVGWGDNGCGEITPPSGLSGVVAIAAGWCHSFALKSDGTVVDWGATAEGETPPAGLTGVVAVAAGNFFDLALKSDGTVVGWGDNSSGQTNPPPGLAGVVAISAKSNRSLALKGDGTVAGWGDNSSGQSTPPNGLSSVVGIAAGSHHSLAIVCVPLAPSSLGATAVGTTQINLSWTDNSNTEAGFSIERAPDNAGSPGSWAQIGTVSTNVTSYADTGLLLQTKYWYRVRAFNGNGFSPYSNLITATTGVGFNCWISSSSGKWETDGNWLLSLAPASSQWGILITNSNTKTVTADATTWGSFPGTMTVSNLTVTGPAGTTNTFQLSNAGAATPMHLLDGFLIGAGGSLLVSSSTLQADVITNGKTNVIDGQAILLSGGTMLATNALTYVGSAIGSTGQLSMSSGSRAVFPSLMVAKTNNSVGTVTVNGGELTVTNNALFIGASGTTQMTVTGGTVSNRVVDIGGRSGVSSGGLGTLTVSGGTFYSQLGTFLGYSAGATGAIWITGGTVTLGSTTAIGLNGTGQMTISNGTVTMYYPTLLNSSGSAGTLTIAGGDSTAYQLRIGAYYLGTGVVWMTGGSLSLTNYTNSVVFVGYGGNGLMSISNNTLTTLNLDVGYGAYGSLDIAGASTVSVWSNMLVGANGSGNVWVNGGQLLVPNGSITDGYYFGTGQITVSNGTVIAHDIVVGGPTVQSVQGALTLAGGSLTALAELIVGDCSTNSVGHVTVNAGSLFVTNATHTAFLDVRNGTLAINGGLLQVDRLVMTNSCGLLVRGGGSLIVGNLLLDSNLSAIGDGIPNGWKQQYGLDPFDPNLANEDPDGDGFTVLQEYLAGTDPTNPASAFRIVSETVTGSDIVVSWMTGIGRR